MKEYLVLLDGEDTEDVPVDALILVVPEGADENGVAHFVSKLPHVKGADGFSVQLLSEASEFTMEEAKALQDRDVLARMIISLGLAR